MGDLFEQSQELFCPLDGNKLTQSQWEWCDRYFLTCSNSHVWEVNNHPYMSEGLEFEPVRMGRCGCGQVVPHLLMRSENGKRLCPDCFEVIKLAWRPDVEKCITRLVITPIKRGEEIIFKYEERVQIHPYPNPYGSGGMWGMGGKETEAEVEQLIESFKSYTERWTRLGVKLEVIRNPELTDVEYINVRKVEEAEKDDSEVVDNVRLQLL